MINKNIKIYCNDEPVLTLCNIYDNNTPISIEKLISLAEFEKMHNTKTDAHKNIIDDIKNTLVHKANISEIPTQISELANDKEYITKTENEKINANIDLSNLSKSGLKYIQENSGGGLEIGDIGIAPLGIDETQGKRRYLNGQTIIQEQYVEFTNKVKSAMTLYPSLFTTEEEWQSTATMSAFGACGKFVVDDVAGTIRLPKITGFIQGLNDLASLGNLVEAGLPNITATHITMRGGTAGTGAIFETGSPSQASFQGGSSPYLTSGAFDASRANLIYGNADTVQPESIKYPYFIQVATGAETEDNIINEIELNNPYSLGDSKYSPVALNNLSWLKSEGQWNAKSVYPAYYEWLLKIYNGVEVVEGASVKLSTEEYTDYDFILNTSDETFRLPIKVNNSAQGYLYFYVGETIQNANLINAGRIEEKLASLIPDNSSLISGYAMPSNRYIDLTLGASGTTYTAPANGWYYLEKKSSATNQYIDLRIVNNYYGLRQYSTGSSSHLVSCMPITQGQVLAITYTAAGTTEHFRFIYAQGEV